MTATNKYPSLNISSQNLVTFMPTYLHTNLLPCLLTFLYAYLNRIPNCPVITVNFNHPKSNTSHPFNFPLLYLVNFIFMTYLPGLGGSPLSSATPSYPFSPKNTKQTIHQLPTDHISSISICISTFLVDATGGWGWVVIIKLKANISSTGTGLANWN